MPVLLTPLQSSNKLFGLNTNKTAESIKIKLTTLT